MTQIEGTATQTQIDVENGKIVIRHDRVVGTQWLTPKQAVEFGQALIHCAGIAEKQKQAMTS